MFDAGRFSLGAERGKSSLATTVRDYEVIETVAATQDEIALAKFDLAVTLVLITPITVGVALLVWWFVYPSLVVLLLMASVIVPSLSLARWCELVIWLKNRERLQTGSISWEKHEVSQSHASAQRTKLVYTDYRALQEGRPQPQEIDSRYAVHPEFSFPPDVVRAVFAVVSSNDWKFTKRLLKENVKGITDENYADLLTEFVGAGFARLKGKDLRQGVAVTKKGQAVMSHLSLPSPTE